MKNKKWVFNLLLYGSIPFLIVYLIKLDYFVFKVINFNYYWLILSIILLWSGFFFSTISWKYALKYHCFNINTKCATISHGLSVFAKYIPGKIWVILGRAAYIAKNDIKLSGLSIISLKEQLLYILIGLLIALFPTLLYFNQDYWPLIIIITILSLVIFLFIKSLHDFLERLLARLFKRKVHFPIITLKFSLKLSGIIFFYWILWILGFFFLLLSINQDANIISVFAFPLAVCYGVLAIVLPGGLGVREGIIAAFLTAVGLDIQTAVTISVISRLWFITGEIFIFFLALILRKTTSVSSVKKSYV